MSISHLLKLARFYVCPQAIRDTHAMAHITYLQAHGPVTAPNEAPARVRIARGVTAKETRDARKHIA